MVLGGLTRSTEDDDGLSGDNIWIDGDDPRGMGEFWEGGCVCPVPTSTLNVSSCVEYDSLPVRLRVRGAPLLAFRAGAV